MSDNNGSLVPDVIRSASDAIHTNIPETMQQVDSIFSNVIGFFNNVVLYPVRAANLTFQYKLENFGKDLKEKTKDTPSENLQNPPVSIAGPVLEALRYTYDEKELREMYENLLASAMDNRNSNSVHPAFVDTIRQMSPFDAQVLEKIIKARQLRCAEITFSITDSNQLYEKAMPRYFVTELCELGDPFIISASITNLERLGLIQVILGKRISIADYDSIKSHPYVLQRETLFKSFNEKFEIKLLGHTIMTNDYGNLFAEVCLAKEI